MKLIIEIDMADTPLGQTDNLRNFLPGYVQEVCNSFPDGVSFSDLMEENHATEFSDAKVILIGQVQFKPLEVAGEIMPDVPSRPMVQVLLTTAKFVEFDRRQSKLRFSEEKETVEMRVAAQR